VEASICYNTKYKHMFVVGDIMTKLYRSPVQVELDDHQLPKRFRWLGRWHRVLSCSIHEEDRPWWERYKVYVPRYRCETYQGLVCDLYYGKL